MNVVLGPCPCIGCRQPVIWNGWEWQAHERRHVCRVDFARPFGYNSVSGSSAESNSLSSDTRLSATTRSAGVVASIEVVAR